MPDAGPKPVRKMKPVPVQKPEPPDKSLRHRPGLTPVQPKAAPPKD